MSKVFIDTNILLDYYLNRDPLAMDRQQLRNAIDTPCKDFEDMLQYQCAVAGGCDVIITNNKKDFAEFSQLPLYTAEEYLNELKR